jgi:hypothetical protein
MYDGDTARMRYGPEAEVLLPDRALIFRNVAFARRASLPRAVQPG